jgi:hypothetical protein
VSEGVDSSFIAQSLLFISQHRFQSEDLTCFADCVLPKLYPIAPLVDALDHCMSTSTVAYCTYEHRFFPEYHPKEHFIDLCAKRGLEVSQIPMEGQHAVYSVDDIEVWKITRKNKMTTI